MSRERNYLILPFLNHIIVTHMAACMELNRMKKSYPHEKMRHGKTFDGRLHGYIIQINIPILSINVRVPMYFYVKKYLYNYIKFSN